MIVRSWLGRFGNRPCIWPLTALGTPLDVLAVAMTLGSSLGFRAAFRFFDVRSETTVIEIWQASPFNPRSQYGFDLAHQHLILRQS